MSINRRQFMTAVAGTVAAASLAQAADAPRPNILWITCEDTGPEFGCYGDAYARTPNIDRLAQRGMIYLNAWSNAPVCAPARTCIITGMYAPSIGGEHMRSSVPLPGSIRLYPQILREAGYYCTNNSKTDYNLASEKNVWDESSGKAHWKNRKSNQPFFAIFNYTGTHESGIRKKGPTKHDPAKAPVPAYHPDTPEVRRDWAQDYDNITAMDVQAGRCLAELEEAGLAEDTIVFFYGDHGSGMPRSKRSACDSGLRVGVVVYIPPKFRHLAPKDYAPGGKSARPIGFVDLAPTLLSLAGVKAPAWMEGRAFMGAHEAAPRQYLHGFRGRMDERYDLVRTVTDGRFVYIRNYMPHRIPGQHVGYQFQTVTTQVWRRLYDEGKLQPPKTYFWEPKAPEELYDLQSDPDEVKNLAASADHQEILQRLRAEQQAWAASIRDLGFLPEGEIHARAKGSTPYEMARDDAKYPFARVFAMAELATNLKPDAIPQLKAGLKDPDSAVRWWAANGMLMRGKAGTEACSAELAAALKDTSPYVRIAAAEALARHGTEADLQPALAALLDAADCTHHGVFPAMYALIAIDELGRKADSIRPALRKLPAKTAGTPPRADGYVGRLLATLNGEAAAD